MKHWDRQIDFALLGLVSSPFSTTTVAHFSLSRSRPWVLPLSVAFAFADWLSLQSIAIQDFLAELVGPNLNQHYNEQTKGRKW